MRRWDYESEIPPTSLPAPEGAPAGAADVATPPAAPHKNEINALAIVWGLIKGWLAGLFGKRPA